MRLPFATKSAKGRSVALTAERLVNLYAEQAPQGSKSQVVVHGCPGLERFCEVNSERPRGLYRLPRSGRLFLVAGQGLYEVFSDGSSTTLGTIAGSGRVGMADNGDQLCIVTGPKGYIYDSDGLREIADRDFPGADDVTVLDGFFVFLNPGSGQSGEQFFKSGLYDGESFDALDFASAESYPDDLVRVFADHSELLLFGSETIEIWFNAGAADFPFRRAQGSVIEQGIGAKWSIAKCDESVLWLDNEGSVRRLEGNTPVRISNHAEEVAIAKGDWANATAWSYVEEGHSFYVLTVPARTLAQTAVTLTYDAATNQWHERKSHGRDYSRSGFYARAFGKHITCDLNVARLYTQSLDVYQEDGEHLIAEMQLPQVQMDGERFIVDSLQLDMEVGVDGVQDLSPPAEQNLLLNVETNRNEITPYRYSGGTFTQAGTEYAYGPQGVLRLCNIGDNRIAMYASSKRVLETFIYNGDSVQPLGNGLSIPGGAVAGLCPLGLGRVAWYSSILGSLRAYAFDGSDWAQVGNSYSYGPGLDRAELVALSDSRIVVVNDTIDQMAAFDFDGTSFTPVGTPLPLDALIYPAMTALSDGTIIYIDNTNRTLTAYRFDGATFSQVGTPLPLAVSMPNITTLPGDVIAVSVDGITDALRAFTFDGSTFTQVGATNMESQSQPGVSALRLLGWTAPAAYGRDIMLDTSGNTRTWDMTQEWQSMGKQGEYNTRVIWRRLGQYDSFTPRIAISAPVKRALFAAYAKIRPTR